MNRKKQLQKKQRAVLDELFRGELDEEAILERHKVKRAVYNKWCADKSFADEFARRMEALNRQSELIIAKYRALAAVKLVQLTESDKEETARKACLDIISLPKPAGKKTEQSERIQAAIEDGEHLPPAVAGRLLAALAEEEKPPANND